METVSFSEMCNFEGESIEVKYEGIPLKQDIDEDEVKRMIRNFVDNHKHDNMIENVTILRTILREYQEISLDVIVSCDDEKEKVFYLNLYNLHWFNFTKNSQKYKIKYDNIMGLELNYHNEVDNLKKYTDDLSDIMKYIVNDNIKMYKKYNIKMYKNIHSFCYTY